LDAVSNGIGFRWLGTNWLEGLGLGHVEHLYRLEPVPTVVVFKIYHLEAT